MKRAFCILFACVALAVSTAGAFALAYEPTEKTMNTALGVRYYTNTDATVYYQDCACGLRCAVIETYFDEPVYTTGDILTAYSGDWRSDYTAMYSVLSCVVSPLDYIDHTGADHITAYGVVNSSVDGYQNIFVPVQSDWYEPTESPVISVLPSADATSYGITANYLALPDNVVNVDVTAYYLRNLYGVQLSYSPVYDNYPVVSRETLEQEFQQELQQAVQGAYNDGLINGTQNMTAIAYISEVLNGVTASVANVLDFEVMGVSITFLFSVVVAVACITLIIKIIRG